MKKTTIIVLFLVFSVSSFSQTTSTTPGSDSETALLGMLGGFSAAYLLNTFELIDALTTQHANKLEADDMIVRKFNAQKNIIDVITKQVDDAIRTKALTTEADKTFVEGLQPILTGLQKQLKLYTDYISSATSTKKAEYETTRKEGRKKLNALLGIED
jgi:hypothetical protein